MKTNEMTAAQIIKADKMDLILNVIALRKEGASFNQIEKTLSLKPTNGMTAFNILKAVDRLKGK